jgi:hypothetical protein
VQQPAHHAGRLKVTIVTTSTFAPALRKQICDLLAAGGQISRDGATVVVEGPPQVADTLRAEAEQLATSIVPSVTADDAALVRSLLEDATGRFSARGPNLQQMPKGRQKGFRRIFAAPAGQLVMALDYSQIELRAVAEIVSYWAGEDSILRQSFAASPLRWR